MANNSINNDQIENQEEGQQEENSDQVTDPTENQSEDQQEENSSQSPDETENQTEDGQQEDQQTPTDEPTDEPIRVTIDEPKEDEKRKPTRKFRWPTLLAWAFGILSVLLTIAIIICLVFIFACPQLSIYFNLPDLC